ARDGTVVKVPANSLKPDSEAAHNPADYGARSHASQLFQVTALNMYLQTESFKYTDKNGKEVTVPPGGMRFEQHMPKAGDPKDTGERMIDTTTHPPKVVSKSVDITDNGIVNVNNRLTGETGTDVMIDHKEYVYGDEKGVSTVKSEAELNNKIAEAAKNGKLPIIIGVSTENEPWLHDSGAGAAGGSGGGHVITVTGYEAGPPAKVEIDNQWGERDDHFGKRSIAVHDLYLSMRPSDNKGQIADLQRDVDWDRAHNTIDTRKEFEILRLRHNLPAGDANKLSDADYKKLVGEQLEAAGKRWEEQKKNGTFNQAEHDNAMQKFQDMVSASPPNQRLEWTEKAYKSGVINNDQYDVGLASAIVASKARWREEDAKGTGNPAERRAFAADLKRQMQALPKEEQKKIMDMTK
ncbi:MAG: hypothetical protein K2X27_06045, partial [Candidatus Obscuribacterales bacterium]|nr:hypothetical protein [Candidatus Obscuribacterales bacterium]